MKLFFKINLAIFIASLFLVSCYKDKGNYDYVDINEVAIEGLADTTVFFGEPFKVTPDISGTIDKNGDPSKYTYKWTALGPGNWLPADRLRELGTSHDLDLSSVTLAPATWTVYLFVTEIESGITPFKFSTIFLLLLYCILFSALFSFK